MTEEGLVAKQTEAAKQVHPRHADYDYAAHRDKSGKDKALSDQFNAPFSH
jgi:hypothetical protein